MKKVYICSPCRGDYENNIQRAKEYSRAAVEKGVIPVRNGFEAISELKPDEEPESGEEDDPNIGSVTIHLPARGGSIHVHLDGATILTLADRLISDPGVHIEIGG